jgi:hypothetical protein
MEQIIRELKRQLAGEKLTPEQLKGLITISIEAGMNITSVPDGSELRR